MNNLLKERKQQHLGVQNYVQDTLKQQPKKLAECRMLGSRARSITIYEAKDDDEIFGKRKYPIFYQCYKSFTDYPFHIPLIFNRYGIHNVDLSVPFPVAYHKAEIGNLVREIPKFLDIFKEETDDDCNYLHIRPFSDCIQKDSKTNRSCSVQGPITEAIQVFLGAVNYYFELKRKNWIPYPFSNHEYHRTVIGALFDSVHEIFLIQYKCMVAYDKSIQNNAYDITLIGHINYELVVQLDSCLGRNSDFLIKEDIGYSLSRDTRTFVVKIINEINNNKCGYSVELTTIKSIIGD